MSNRIWAQIEIGGNIPAAKLQDLAHELSQECFEEGGPQKNDIDSWIQHIRDTAEQDSTLELIDSSASWGMFDLEVWLLKNDVTFVRQCEADGEYDGEYVWHVQGTPNNESKHATKSCDGKNVIDRDAVVVALNIIEEIPTLEEAALRVNDTNVSGLIAKEALRTGEINPAHLLRHWLNEYYPDPPDVPALTIM